MGAYMKVIEDNAAVDDKLIFPSVQSCQAIICAQPNGKMLGTHLTVGSDKDTVEDCLEMMSSRKSVQGVSAIYLLGSYGTNNVLPATKDAFGAWDSHGYKSIRWPRILKTMKSKFGKCPIFVFDKGLNHMHIRATAAGGRAVLEYLLQDVNELPDPNGKFTYLAPQNFQCR